MDAGILTRLRSFCLALPDAHETATWGHVQFRVRNKIFCGTGDMGGGESIFMKVGIPMQGVLLQDARFFRTPYIGQHGWVSLRLDQPVDWPHLEALIEGSYQMVRHPRRKG